MTEKELRDVQTLAAKLTRIWLPSQTDNQEKWRFDGNNFRFGAEVRKGIYFRFIFIESRVWDYVLILAQRGGGRMTFSGYDERFSVEPKKWEMEHHKEFKQFATQWLPFFRRGCWLSGCPLECTEHEKLEWALWLRKQGANDE